MNKEPLLSGWDGTLGILRPADDGSAAEDRAGQMRWVARRRGRPGFVNPNGGSVTTGSSFRSTCRWSQEIDEGKAIRLGRLHHDSGEGSQIHTGEPACRRDQVDSRTATEGSACADDIEEG